MHNECEAMKMKSDISMSKHEGVRRVATGSNMVKDTSIHNKGQFIVLDSEPLFTATVSGILHSYSKMDLEIVARKLRLPGVMKALEGAKLGKFSLITIVACRANAAEAFYRDTCKAKDIPVYVNCLGLESLNEDFRPNVGGYVIFLPEMAMMEERFTQFFMSDLIENITVPLASVQGNHPHAWIFPSVGAKYSLERTWVNDWRVKVQDSYGNLEFLLDDPNAARLAPVKRKILELTLESVGKILAHDGYWTPVYCNGSELRLNKDVIDLLSPAALNSLLYILNKSHESDRNDSLRLDPEMTYLYTSEKLIKKLFSHSRSRGLEDVVDPLVVSRGETCKVSEGPPTRQWIHIYELLGFKPEVDKPTGEGEDAYRENTVGASVLDTIGTSC